MRRWAGLVWMGGGVALGSLITGILLGAVWLPTGPKHSAVLQRLTTPLLARVLMIREASTIVDDARYPGSGWDGIKLFSRPQFEGGSLCRVRVYSFDEYSRTRARSGGTPPATGALWGNSAVPRPASPTEVSDQYGIWADPADESNRASTAGPTACAAYDDFDHLISGDSWEILPAVFLVDVARKAARRGEIDFTVTCLGRLQDHKRGPCDGVAYLRLLDLKKIESVRVIGDPIWGPESRRQFLVAVNDSDIHGRALATSLTVTSEERGHMRDPQIVSIALDQDAY